MWFRRDLRVSGNAAIEAGAADGDQMVALFVLDDRLRRPSGANRLAFMYRALRSLNQRLNGRLVVRAGDPADVVPRVAREAGADRVLCAADFGPYGRDRDNAVAIRLAQQGQWLDRVASPYAVDPGTVVKADGTPYQVFGPYYRAWTTHLDPETAPHPEADWIDLPKKAIPRDPVITATLPEATEAAAHERLDQFLTDGLANYHRSRDFPDRDGTSRLSPYLKFGLLHPNQILARLHDHQLGGDECAQRLRAELAWRDFYADVLWHAPDSARRAWQPAMRTFRADHGPGANELFDAWAKGRTGFPLIDAGMRQLSAEGWMHNRVRMVTASFLVKDLHLPWERGARHFLTHLVDGDLASNNHGWQWVAGSGTDPAPFFRIFNPVAQSRQWDPDGVYVRRFVPELRGVTGAEVHQPWRLPGGPPPGYPPPVVEHSAEREEALARYRETSARVVPGPR